MWLISLRDLQWRRRRFLIAVVATAMMFALALVLTEVSASFKRADLAVADDAAG